MDEFPISSPCFPIINTIWLVVWNMAFVTFHILGIRIPGDKNMFCNHRPDMFCFPKIWETKNWRCLFDCSTQDGILKLLPMSLSCVRVVSYNRVYIHIYIYIYTYRTHLVWNTRNNCGLRSVWVASELQRIDSVAPWWFIPVFFLKQSVTVSAFIDVSSEVGI